jgi:outer membrane lipoprotein SlyB
MILPVTSQEFTMRSVVLAASLALAGLSGCVQSGTNAGVSQAQTISGTIVSVLSVIVSNRTDQTAGAIAGAVVGGVIGNQIGGGLGRDLATGVGAAGGALAGSRLAAGANDRVSQEWTIRLSDGRTVTLVQDGAFRVGQKVNLVTQGNSTRIVAA